MDGVGSGGKLRREAIGLTLSDISTIFISYHEKNRSDHETPIKLKEFIHLQCSRIPLESGPYFQTLYFSIDIVFKVIYYRSGFNEVLAPLIMQKP